MKKSNPSFKAISTAVIIALVVAAMLIRGTGGHTPQAGRRSASYGHDRPRYAQVTGYRRDASARSDKGYCVRAVDGDTIIVMLDGIKERVRLIGVDTPETVRPNTPVQYYGKEASAFTKMMAEGNTVTLTYDWEARDKYGRLLAYVYLEDGTFLNAEIVRQGYGHAYTRFPFRYMREFRAYERQARKKGLGLWGLRR